MNPAATTDPPYGPDTREHHGKLMSMAEAIGGLLHDGDTLFLSGMQHGEPAAAIHEILRQEQRDLTLVPQLPEVGQLLLTEGRVSVLKHAYTGALYLRRGHLAELVASLKGELRIEEYSHGLLDLALAAGAQGLPYLPSLSGLGTDYARVNPENITTGSCPFTGAPLQLVAAIVPDLAIVHVQRADVLGNAQKSGSLGMDVNGAHAARRVIVVTEEVVSSDRIRDTPDATVIPGLIVDAVVHEPWGAHPQHLAGCYGSDVPTFIRQVSDPESYERYLREDVRGVADRRELMELIARRQGTDHLDRLRAEAGHDPEPVVAESSRSSGKEAS
ncbi:CoA transferase subunit A [Streptomyces phaeochromogenes]|uniref:CoA transferase subunit A n=1 Tax=Streptomyces phaeochromogenes TaxID=1923 RepID=UPI0033E94F40